MIHEAYPKSRPVVITIFTRLSVRTSVHSFQILQNKTNMKWELWSLLGLAEGIIDDTQALFN